MERSVDPFVTGAYPTWESRRYLDDQRPFLVKFKEIADQIGVFPFQWIVFPGSWAAHLSDMSDFTMNCQLTIGHATFERYPEGRSAKY